MSALQPPVHANQVTPILVADESGLESLVATLEKEPAVALDTESNSFHVYRERICLIQVSTRTTDYIVDPLAVDVRPLGPILTSDRQVVLHGADYDVRCMKREYGWRLPRLFDTMTAARHLGYVALGLSGLVESCFGVRLSKEHQRSDWGHRPLDAHQLRYAALDTHYLLPLFDRLTAQLQEKGLTDAANGEFKRIAAVEPKQKVFDPEGYRRLKGCRELDRIGRDVLRSLWVAREEQASKADRPPFKVIGEQTMIEIARRRPATPEELERIPGVTRHVLRRMGSAIQAALLEAKPPPST